MQDKYQKFLIINQRNLEKYQDIINKIPIKHPDIEIYRYEGNEKYLDIETIISFIRYSNFSEVVKKNRLNEFWDLTTNNAIVKIWSNQCIYLNCPIYYVWDNINDELFTLECGLEDFLYRFR